MRDRSASYLDGCVFFFFKQKTAYEMRISDWSSDVCSSDLLLPSGRPARWQPGGPRGARGLRPPAGAGGALSAGPALLKVTALEVSPGALASTPWRRLHGRG